MKKLQILQIYFRAGEWHITFKDNSGFYKTIQKVKGTKNNWSRRNKFGNVCEYHNMIIFSDTMDDALAEHLKTLPKLQRIKYFLLQLLPN